MDVSNDQKAKSGKVTDEQKEAFDDFWDEWKWDPLEGRNRIISSFCPQGWHSRILDISVPSRSVEQVPLGHGVEKKQNPTMSTKLG